MVPQRLARAASESDNAEEHRYAEEWECYSEAGMYSWHLRSPWSCEIHSLARTPSPSLSNLSMTMAYRSSATASHASSTPQRLPDTGYFVAHDQLYVADVDATARAGSPPLSNLSANMAASAPSTRRRPPDTEHADGQGQLNAADVDSIARRVVQRRRARAPQPGQYYPDVKQAVEGIL